MPCNFPIKCHFTSSWSVFCHCSAGIIWCDVKSNCVKQCVKNPSLHGRCYCGEITLKGCKLQIQIWHPQHYSCTTSLTTVTCWISKCPYHLFVLVSNQTRSLIPSLYLSVYLYFCCTIASKLLNAC